MKTDDTFGKKLAVLMTCHNRREKTLRCLTSLFSCRRAAGLPLRIRDQGGRYPLLEPGNAESVGGRPEEERGFLPLAE